MPINLDLLDELEGQVKKPAPVDYIAPARKSSINLALLESLEAEEHKDVQKNKVAVIPTEEVERAEELDKYREMGVKQYRSSTSGVLYDLTGTPPPKFPAPPGSLRGMLEGEKLSGKLPDVAKRKGIAHKKYDPIAEAIVSGTEKVYEDIGIVSQMAQEMGTPTAQYTREEADAATKELPNRLLWYIKNLSTLGGRIPPVANPLALIIYDIENAKGMMRGEVKATDILKRQRVELAKEAEHFAGFGSATMPLASDTGTLAIEWGFLYPALFKLAGLGNAAITNIPKVRKGLAAIKSAGGLDKVAAKFPRLYNSTAKILGAFTKGAQVGGVMGLAETVGEEPLEEVLKTTTKRAVLMGGFAAVFQAASQRDTAKYIKKFRIALLKASNQRFAAEIVNVKSMIPKGPQQTSAIKGLEGAKTRDLRDIDSIVSRAEAQLRGIKEGKLYQQGQEMVETPQAAANRFIARGFKSQRGFGPGEPALKKGLGKTEPFIKMPTTKAGEVREAVGEAAKAIRHPIKAVQRAARPTTQEVRMPPKPAIPPPVDLTARQEVEVAEMDQELAEIQQTAAQRPIRVPQPPTEPQEPPKPPEIPRKPEVPTQEKQRERLEQAAKGTGPAAESAKRVLEKIDAKAAEKAAAEKAAVVRPEVAEELAKQRGAFQKYKANMPDASEQEIVGAMIEDGLRPPQATLNRNSEMPEVKEIFADDAVKKQAELAAKEKPAEVAPEAEGKVEELIPRQAVAKQPWEMTHDDFVKEWSEEATKGIQAKEPDRIYRVVKNDAELKASRYHKEYVQEAVEQGKPVPRAVLEEYKYAQWAQEALGEKPAPKVTEVEKTEEELTGMSRERRMKLLRQTRKRIREHPAYKEFDTVFEDNLQALLGNVGAIYVEPTLWADLEDVIGTDRRTKLARIFTKDKGSSKGWDEITGYIADELGNEEARGWDIYTLVSHIKAAQEATAKKGLFKPEVIAEIESDPDVQLQLMKEEMLNAGNTVDEIDEAIADWIEHYDPGGAAGLEEVIFDEFIGPEAKKLRDIKQLKGEEQERALEALARENVMRKERTEGQKAAKEVLKANDIEDVPVKEVEEITEDDIPFETVEGRPTGATVTLGEKQIILLAYGADSETGYHEGYHILRSRLTEKDLKFLKNKFTNEEAEAREFARYVRTGKVDPLYRTIWRKLLNILRKIKSSLQGRGYRTVEDIFGEIRAGTVAKISPTGAGVVFERVGRVKEDKTIKQVGIYKSAGAENKYNLGFVRRIQQANNRDYLGTLGEFLRGEKIRELYKDALDTPMFALTKPIQGGKLVKMPEGYIFSGAGGKLRGERTIFINPDHPLFEYEIEDTILEEASHTLRGLKGRKIDTPDLEKLYLAGNFEKYQQMVSEETADKMVKFAKSLKEKPSKVQYERGVFDQPVQKQLWLPLAQRQANIRKIQAQEKYAKAKEVKAKEVKATKPYEHWGKMGRPPVKSALVKAVDAEIEKTMKARSNKVRITPEQMVSKLRKADLYYDPRNPLPEIREAYTQLVKGGPLFKLETSTDRLRREAIRNAQIRAEKARLKNRVAPKVSRGRLKLNIRDTTPMLSPELGKEPGTRQPPTGREVPIKKVKPEGTPKFLGMADPDVPLAEQIPEAKTPTRILLPDKWFKENIKTFKKDKLASMGRFAVGAYKGFDFLFEASSERLYKINPQLFRETRRYVYDVMTRSAEMTDQMEPFLEGYKAMSKTDRRTLDLALKNSYHSKIIEIVTKNKLEAEYAQAREVLNVIYDAALEVGIDMQYKRDYWHRDLKDPKGFLEYFQKGDDWSIIEQALEARAKRAGRTLDELTTEETAQVLNTLLRGYRFGGMALSRPGAAKERTVEVIDRDLNQFYSDSSDAIIKYIKLMNSKIAEREFFGKETKEIADLRKLQSSRLTRLLKLQKRRGLKAGTEQKYTEHISKTAEAYKAGQERLERLTTRKPADSIGGYVHDLWRTGQIQPSQEKEIQNLLTAIFYPKGMGRGMGLIATGIYIDTLNSHFQALTQLDEFAYALYRSPVKAIPAAIRTALRKSKIKPSDIGIRSIGEEFKEPSLHSYLSWQLKAIFFEQVDRLNKENLINTALSKMQSQARKNPASLNKRLVRVFGKEHKQVIEDLKKPIRSVEDASDNVRYLLFNEVLDVQPIAITEMPEFYNRSGNWKLIYTLKTFYIKRFSAIRREAFKDMMHVKTFARGFKNLVMLSLWFALLGAASDSIKDFLKGKTFDLADSVIENTLRIFMSSKFQVMQAKREGIGTAVLEQFVPPTKVYDAVSKDFATVAEGKDRGFELWRSIPIVGEPYYWWFGRGKEKNEAAEGTKSTW